MNKKILFYGLVLIIENYEVEYLLLCWLSAVMEEKNNEFQIKKNKKSLLGFTIKKKFFFFALTDFFMNK